MCGLILKLNEAKYLRESSTFYPARSTKQVSNQRI